MKILVFLVVFLGSYSSLDSQSIHQKLYELSKGEYLYCKIDQHNQSRAYYVTTKGDERMLPIGMSVSRELNINNGVNNWIVYKNLIITVEFADLRDQAIPGFIANFRVTPLDLLLEELHPNEVNKRLGLGRSNITDDPLKPIPNSLDRPNSTLYQYDFAVSEGKLIFMVIRADGILNIWKWGAEITKLELGAKRASESHWTLISTIPFKEGMGGFNVYPKNDGKYIVATNNKGEFEFSFEDKLIKRISTEMESLKDHLLVLTKDNKVVSTVRLSEVLLDNELDIGKLTKITSRER
jgi:hypothetical protein